MNEQFAVGAEGQVIDIPQAAGKQLDGFPVQVGPDDHPSRCLAPGGMTARILVTRAHQIAFVVPAVRTRRRIRFDRRGVVSNHDVDQSVRAECQAVRTMLAHLSFKIEEEPASFQFAVMILIRETIESIAFGTVPRHVDLTVKRQNALHVLHCFAVLVHLVHDAILVCIDYQQQGTSFARKDRSGQIR